MLAVLVSSLFVSPVSAGTQDFYFSDFTGDYYLTKDLSGISHLKVVENVTAVFPNFNQNKGICRQIPYTNQGGANVTLPDLNSTKIKVTRNGVSEPIYSISKYEGHYEVCTGTDDYVLGEQVYTFEYEFEKVVTDFNDYQELYWDTNGNGASQRFDQVTARVHFDETTKNNYAGKQWCYVGKYHESGQERCRISETDDGVEFVAVGLMAGENLTFDIELKPGSFVVPAPELNYALVWVMVLMVVICVFLLIWFPGRKYHKASQKIREYKGIFVAPQYQPNRDYHLSEMAEVYLGKKKDYKVGILLDLVVRRKIEIKKNEEVRKSKQWEIIARDVAGLEPEEKYVLELLNGGSSVNDGDTITVQRHVATRTLQKLGEKFNDEVIAKMKKDGLVEKDYKIGNSSTSTSVLGMIAGMILAVPFVIMGGSFVMVMMSYAMDFAQGFGGKIVGEEVFLPVSFVTVGLTILIWMMLARRTRKYINHTTKGLEMSKYMEGLKLYIEMAEAERLKFLQSVEGADVSATGIVKLYEKLLPYASVFGLEESWMDEMEQYCKIQEVEEPDYLLSGFTAYELARTMRNAVSYANNSTHYSSSSVSGGGGWSSGGSGGGGGGFSGGGGGGGGFGGR